MGATLIDASAEQRVLKYSLVLTVVIAASGIALGLLSGSMSIVFDGLFSVIDVAMGALLLWVARLVTREETRTFQYGFWHIEPMALAFNGGMLMILCIYAAVNAVGSFMSGGQEVELGWAIGYSAGMALITFGMYFYERSANRSAKSQLLHLDAQSWLMSALAAAGLLVGFAVAWGLGKTQYAGMARFIDPAILAVLSLAFVGMPIRTVRQALAEMLLIAPTQLDTAVREVMDDVIARHAFTSYTSYVAKVGRGQFIEIHIVVPPDQPIETVATLDAIRDEIGSALGADGPDKWLTVDFTGQEQWT
jgi:cation diffusion facilitator family transporter